MKISKFLRFGAALFGTALCLVAGPASPDPIKIRQPDGSIIHARIQGDEFQGWVETQDGYTIVRNKKSGVWEYGVLDSLSGQIQSSGLPVLPNAQAPSFLEKHQQPTRNMENQGLHFKGLQQFQQERTQAALKGSVAGPQLELAPITGTRKLLFVLVNFSDRTLTTSPTTWNSTIFQTGGAKSVRQFYQDNSFGTLDVAPVPHTHPSSPAGVLAVTIASAHPNCGKDYVYATEVAWINQALAQAATYVDFAALDTNTNGTIETTEAVFYFIPAGYEAAGSAKTPNIWAHAYSGGTGLTAGTKKITRWALNGELNNTDNQHPMGVIAHELGHAMTGLPDLYDTSGTNSGLGNFSLMAGGSWGADTGEEGGITPVTLDAWSRHRLGWTTPITPTTNGEIVSLGTALSGSSATALLQNTTLSSQEYFLVENRHPSKWDRGLVRFSGFGSSWQGGLLVMHVDNSIPNNAYVAGSHQMVLAEHADNAASATSGRGSSLFTTTNNSSFIPTSTPASNYYNGASSAMGFTAASAPGTTMTFTMFAAVDATAPLGKPGKPTATTATDTVTFSWDVGTASDPESDITGYRLQVGTTPSGNDVFDGITGNAMTKTLTDMGLKDGQPLYARVAAINGAYAALESAWSDTSDSIAVDLPVFDGAVLENTNCAFKTIGPWVPTTSTFYSGTSCAETTGVLDNSRTYLQTRVTGPGSLEFYWKAKSEPGYDYLTFSIDGTAQPGKISGTTTFAKQTIAVPGGSHILRWTYAKDADTAPANDGAWVDFVTWTPSGASASISPATYTTITSGTVPYIATLSGSTLNSAAWTINNAGGTFSPLTTASGGTTTFTGGATAGSFLVSATPADSGAIAGTASLTLVAPTSVNVGVSATATSVLINAPVTFTSSVTQLTNPAVSWGLTGGTFGTQTSTTATWSSAAAGNFTITATSTVATGRNGTATVTVLDPAAITISVDHPTAMLLPGATQSLVGTTSTGAITWSLPVGQGTLNTTSTATGVANVYTAPANPMTDLTATVTLTNSLNTAKMATSIITVKTYNVNNDAVLDLRDILTLASDWGTTNSRSRLSGGASVGEADLALLLTGLGF